MAGLLAGYRGEMKMKLLKDELWDGVISEAHDSVRPQVYWQVNWLVNGQVYRRVQRAVSWGVDDQVSAQLDGEIE